MQVQQVHLHEFQMCVQVQVHVQVQGLLPDIHPWRQPSPSPAYLPPTGPVSASWSQGTLPG